MNVGVTGHQQLPSPTMWDWVASAVGHEIAKFPKPLVGVTCLALGADQLFARAVLKQGGRLLHIKPFVDYERTFDEAGLRTYCDLSHGLETEVMEVIGGDEDAYLAAGKRVVDHSDRLVAVWDGLPARGKGGTADVVRYALERFVDVLHFNPISQQFRFLTYDQTSGPRYSKSKGIT